MVGLYSTRFQVAVCTRQYYICTDSNGVVIFSCMPLYQTSKSTTFFLICQLNPLYQLGKIRTKIKNVDEILD